MRLSARFAAMLLVATPLTTACSKKPAPSDAPAPSGSASSTPAPNGTASSGAPSSKPYTGPTGTVRGTVTIAGDDAPVLEDVLRSIPDKCAPARNIYGKLFRTGNEGQAADVLVTVTGYDGKIPATKDHVAVTAQDCAWNARTVGMTFGQHLAIAAKDAQGYVPDLIGAPTPVKLIPLPGGKPVKIKPEKPGRYGLADQAHLFMYADVFAVRFSTLDVTGLDGSFEVPNVPVGTAQVNALLPVATLVGEQKVTVKANETTTVDFTLTFNAAEYEARKRAATSSSARTPDAPAPKSPSPASSR